MERDFLLKLAKTYQTYEVSIIEDCLADDMHYASMWVFHEMTSKDEYMDYLTEKLQTLKEHGVRMEFQVVQGRMHKKALLVTNDEAPEGKFGFVADFNEEGKVKMLNITVQAFF